MGYQLICMAIVNPAAKGDSFKVTWTFDSKTLKKCKLSYNRVNDDVI